MLQDASNPVINGYSCSSVLYKNAYKTSISIEKNGSLSQSSAQLPAWSTIPFKTDNCTLSSGSATATMLSILLFLSITALLYQFPATETHALDYAEAQKSVTALKQLSKFTNVANYPLVEVQAPWFPSHSIGVEQLTVDDTVVLSYTSPEKGRVILRFIQEETNDIIFSIDLRYTYDKFNEKNVVVFNSFQGGVWK